MFDIHTHIIPGVDDGSKSINMSEELLKLEADSGVTKIMLTPHMNQLEKNKDQILQGFERLKKEANSYGIQLYLGSEIYYYPGMVEDIEKGILLPFHNTKTILVEFSTRVETPIADIVYDLKVKGFSVIVAHIERYEYLTLESIEEIHQYAKIQVNAGAFVHKSYKKIVAQLMKNDLIDYIASDCHDPVNRTVDFHIAQKKLKKYPELYHRIFEEEPEFFN